MTTEIRIDAVQPTGSFGLWRIHGAEFPHGEPFSGLCADRTIVATCLGAKAMDLRVAVDWVDATEHGPTVLCVQVCD